MIRTFFALFPLMLALPFGMDIYVPAVPHITTVFNTTDALMQATLNLFMLTTGIMQLWIGPYSDSIGRIRPTLLCNLSFAIGCIICALSHNITTLIIGRVIQAAGAGGLIVLGNAIARDLYTGNLLAKLYSGLNGVIAFAPLFILTKILVPKSGSLVSTTAFTFFVLIFPKYFFVNFFANLKSTSPDKTKIAFLCL